MDKYSELIEWVVSVKNGLYEEEHVCADGGSFLYQRQQLVDDLLKIIDRK